MRDEGIGDIRGRVLRIISERDEFVTGIMEAKKTTRTVTQMKTPLGWSKSGRLIGNNKANNASDSNMRSVNTKANSTLDSMGSSNSSGSSDASGSSRLEDSALLVSPPNQARILETLSHFCISVHHVNC